MRAAAAAVAAVTALGCLAVAQVPQADPASTRGSSSGSGDPLDAAELRSDDECVAGGGNEESRCALDALQRRVSRSAGRATSGRKGSFLVIGDWGFDAASHGGDLHSDACQRTIAAAMLRKMRELGDVKFIINVADSFYPRGVASKDDPQWESKWRQIYHPELRSVPWYSVYGNHDYIGDPCACSEDPAQCAQVNSNINDLNYFYMPDLNWFKEHPELDLEVVALDMNEYMWAFSRNVQEEYQCAFDCQYTHCEQPCERILKQRAEEGFALFRERAARSGARNLLVFSHYPTDYFFSNPAFIRALSDDSRHHIAYFAGHRHSTDNTSTTSTAPNTNWVVGGGGGWSCDSPDQGFVVGEISAAGELSTYSVLVDPNACCQPPPKPWTTPTGGPFWRKCSTR